MNVVQIVPGVNGEAAGPAYSVPGIARGLCANEVNAHVYSLGPYPRRDLHCALTMFPRSLERLFPVFGFSTSLHRQLKKDIISLDVIHMNGLWMMTNIYPSWVVRKARRKNIHVPKLVLSPRGAFARWALNKGRFKKWLMSKVLQERALTVVDMFHATSEKEYEEIRAQGYRQPVAIVPIGMDLPELEVSGSEFRVSGFGLEKRLKRVVFFGRLHKVKGVDRLLLAWEKVARDGWEVVIAGPDCGMLEELKGIVAERKLPRVSFVGEINGSAKYEFLAGGDVYVLPSDTENFGVTVAEALASGTPVIASQGTPWQGLERERCGRWVPIGVEPLAAALEELMGMDDAERAAMGARGRAWIQRDFSWKGIGAQMKAAYEWLLAPEKVERPEFVVSG